MNTFVIFTKANQEPAIAMSNDWKRANMYTNRGYTETAQVSAENSKLALEAFAKGEGTEVVQSYTAPTMAHGYDVESDELPPVQKHIVGYVLFVAGLLAVFLGFEAYGSKAVMLFNVAALLEFVAIILISIGHCQAMTVKSHNILLKKLDK